MRNLYEGGQCNPNAMGSSSNQYKRMMGNLEMGNQNAEKIINFGQQGQTRQAMFEQMNQGWKTSCTYLYI